MKIFNDKYQLLQNTLDNEGWVKFQFLPESVVKELIALYHYMPNAKNDFFGFHVSLDIFNPQIINEIASKISLSIQNFSDNFFENYKLISPRFAVKEAHQNSLIPPHQDWSFVDEDLYQSYNLWIALTPSTLKNGTLGFMRKSHKVLKNFRATPLPIFQVPFHDFANELIEDIEYIELEPGEAFFFNSRIIHASKPNISENKRINIAIELTHKDAPLIHFYKSPISGKIEQFEIDSTFFNQYSNAKLTEMYHKKESITNYKKIKEFKNDILPISKIEFYTSLKA